MTATDLMTQIEPLVRGCAERLAGKIPPGVADFDDLYQCGMAEVWRLSSGGGFDPSRLAKPTTWLYPRVVGSMYDQLRDLHPLTRTHRGDLEAAGQTAPRHHSLGVPGDGRGGESRDSRHEPADRSPPPEHLIDTDVERVLGGMKELTAVLLPSERELVADYYARGQTLREIGARRQVCESRMSQLLAAAVAKLRERAEELGGYAVVAAHLGN